MDFLTLFLSTAAVVVSIISYVENVLHDRKKDTLEAFNRLQEQVFDNLNRFTPKEVEEIVKHPTSPEYKELSGYIARLEHFCVGVNRKIYDLETVYALAHGYLDGPQLLSRIAPVIERKNRSGEDYYENIHAVLAWMKKRSGETK